MLLGDVFFEGKGTKSVPVDIVCVESFDKWLGAADTRHQAWMKAQGDKPVVHKTYLLPGKGGSLGRVLFIADPSDSFWQFSKLAINLPIGKYNLDQYPDAIDADLLCLAWGLAFYQFNHYKTNAQPIKIAQLRWPKGAVVSKVNNTIESTILTRQLITTPAADMGPEKLEAAVKSVAKAHKAKFKSTIGKALLKQNYPAIHTVGKAAMEEPRLLEFTWSGAKAPKLKVALVGKGVCFDSGGLDLKSSQGMLLMKKDMGGAANVLGLAKLLMAADLPISLHVLIPAVENAISEKAMRPLDICQTRKGLTVEIGNTDAEGRLILIDALARACEEKPDLIIDCATLTGAARVAMGADVPALFSNNSEVAEKIVKTSHEVEDPLWCMPLYRPYEKGLSSAVADLSSTGKSSYGGAITAALFLNKFVDPGIDWVHVDMMAYNLSSSPGRPEGGEAMGMRALYTYIRKAI